MNTNLFTSNFIKVCLANLFLFFSLYTLLPVTFFEISPTLQEYGYKGWLPLGIFVVGLLVGGPFHNYLIEHFNRKKVCSLAYIGVLVPSVIFLVTNQSVTIFIGLAILGIAFGIATAANVTIAIDVTSPRRRSRGNVIYAWAGRLGMVLAIPSSIYLLLTYSKDWALYASIGAIFLAWVMTKLTHHPFRAPTESSTLSWDRFMLPKSWKLLLMMVLVAYMVGSLLPLFFLDAHDYITDITTDKLGFILIPFLVFFGSALLSTAEVHSLLSNKLMNYLLLRTPVVIIGAYFLVVYHHHLSAWSMLICIGLIASFLSAIWRVVSPHRKYYEYNKWSLESQYRIEVISPILTGLFCILLAYTLVGDLQLRGYPIFFLSAQLFIFGIARVSSPLFLLLVLSAKHCERGTANTTHHLGWEIGLSLGVVISIAFKFSINNTIVVGMSILAVIFIIYVFIYFRLHALAKHKHSFKH